jgi:cobyrinic acid a,c-diamide synthase
VLNRVGSERHHALLAEALASIEVPLLGVLPHHPSLELPSRHLGLLPPEELQDLEQRQEFPLLHEVGLARFVDKIGDLTHGRMNGHVVNFFANANPEKETRSTYHQSTIENKVPRHTKKMGAT